MRVTLCFFIAVAGIQWANAQRAPPNCSDCSTAPMLRFSCSQLVVERLDPLVTPGQNPSPHLHQIVGGNTFNTTMDPSIDIPATSTCTSCTFSQDHSNYWTAVLYFRARNGTFKRVPQMPNLFLEGATGGQTVYYIPPYDGVSRTTAFKPGFRMTVGDPALRTDTQGKSSQTSYRCFGTNWEGGEGPPGLGNDTRHFPKQPCLGGIRSNIFFPTCWDGVNLDSPDHKSHVAYPADDSPFQRGSPCPDSHPVRLPQLFYEIMWDTRAFNDLNEWPEDGSQPFVFSTGDPTGYGQHADYVFGWLGDSLQKAMDKRCFVDCDVLKTQSFEVSNACTKAVQVDEQIDGWLKELPGIGPITFS